MNRLNKIALATSADEFFLEMHAMSYTEHEGRKFYKPSHIQMTTAVRGSDRMPDRPKFGALTALVAVFLIAAGLYGLFLLITENL